MNIKQTLFKNNINSYALTIKHSYLENFINSHGPVDLQNVEVDYKKNGEITIQLHPITHTLRTPPPVIPIEKRIKITKLETPKPVKPHEGIEEKIIEKDVQPVKNLNYTIIQTEKNYSGINVILKVFNPSEQQDHYYKLLLSDIGQVFLDWKGFVLPDQGTCKQGLVKSILKGKCDKIFFNGTIWCGVKEETAEGFE